MATNLVSDIGEFLGPQIVSRIASSLGLDKTSTQKAASARMAFTALISLVSKSQGAAKLNDAVAQQQPGVLSSLAGVIGQSGQKALIDNGASALICFLAARRCLGSPVRSRSMQASERAAQRA